MEFVQTGKAREGFLDEKRILKVLDILEGMLLKQLDYNLGFVEAQYPDSISAFIQNLTEKYIHLTKRDFQVNFSKELDVMIEKYTNLQQNPELVKSSINYLIHLLRLDEHTPWQKSEVEIVNRALMQAWSYPSYYLLQVLEETIGRSKAVKLYKKFITHYYIDNPPQSKGDFISLLEHFKERTTGDTTSSEWVLVHTMLGEGKYAFKNKNCPTLFDSTQDLPDTEFKYLVCCYGDYEKFRQTRNDHIILTMEHTLMQGDPYCSRVLHDTRIDYDLRHPAKEFWDNMELGQEEDEKQILK